MMSYNTTNLRQFIHSAFNAEDLKIFLFDYFRTVYEDITPGITKTQQIQMLLEYCDRQDKMPDLLAALKRECPVKFNLDDFVKNQSAPNILASVSSRPSTLRNPSQIFICHAHQDATLAHRLADDLKAHGYDSWIAPDSIRPGEKWVEAINRGLEESGLFVLLMSPEAVASDWVQFETNIAIELTQAGEMKLFPLMLQPCRRPAVWRAFHYISMYDEYEQGLNKLLTTFSSETRYEETIARIENNDNEEEADQKLPLILVIDSEPFIRDIYEMIISSIPGRTAKAGSVLEASRILAQTRPDLIITEVMLPKLDGISFIKGARANKDLATIPIIAIASVVTQDRRKKLEEAGANEIIQKPVETTVLKNEMIRWLKDGSIGQQPSQQNI